MPKKKKKSPWRYVYFCEHCGEFEVPTWGMDDGGISWCAGCADADGHEEVSPPAEIESKIKAIQSEMARLDALVREYNEKAGS